MDAADGHKFEKGDSNRCRNAYERILHAALRSSVLEPHKKNKHISVGRCRMIAIDNGVRIPTYEALSAVGFSENQVPQSEWTVPTDCKRFTKKISEEGLCRGFCERCARLIEMPHAPGLVQPPPAHRPPADTAAPTREPAPPPRATQQRRAPAASSAVRLGMGLQPGAFEGGSAAEVPIVSRAESQVAISLYDLEDCVEGMLLEEALFESALVERELARSFARALDDGTDDEQVDGQPHQLAHTLAQLERSPRRDDDEGSESEQTAESTVDFCWEHYVSSPEQYENYALSPQAYADTCAEPGAELDELHELARGFGGGVASADLSRGRFSSEDWGVAPSPGGGGGTATPLELERVASYDSGYERANSSAIGSPSITCISSPAHDGGVGEVADADNDVIQAVQAEEKALQQVYCQLKRLRSHLSETEVHSGGPCAKRKCRELLQSVVDEANLLQSVYGGGDSYDGRNGPDTKRLMAMSRKGGWYEAGMTRLAAIRLLKGRCEWLCNALETADTVETVETAEAAEAAEAAEPSDGVSAADAPLPSRAPAVARRSPLNRCTLADGRRALVMFCSPTVAPLDTNLEAEALRAAGLLAPGAPIMQGGTFDDLRASLAEFRPHLFWFAGHGNAQLPDGVRTLGFSGADGSLQLLAPAVLANEFKRHMPQHYEGGGHLECVVLNACNSGGADRGTALGDLLYEYGVACIACWKSRAHNDASAHFARGFASSFVKGDNYSAAYANGRRQVESQLEAQPDLPGVMTQTYELIDPSSDRVTQPYDVRAGRAPRKQLYRVAKGEGRGRVAAGEVTLLSHSQLLSPAAPPTVADKKRDMGARSVTQAASKMYVSCKDPSPPRFGWFSIGDLRCALVVVTFYRMMLTRPITFSTFYHRWFAVRMPPWLSPFATITFPFRPLYIYFSFLLQSLVGALFPRDEESEGVGVFFALPSGLISRVNAQCYFDLSYEVGAFLQCGSNRDAIQHAFRDVVTTKEYWFTLLDCVGANRPHQLARWENGCLSEVGPGLDSGKCDLVCKITDSYIGLGDILFKRGVDFHKHRSVMDELRPEPTKDDTSDASASDASSSSVTQLTTRLENNEMYRGKIALLSELIAPIQRERVRLSNDGFSNVHSFDILTVKDSKGEVKVLSCLLWTDCHTWTTHTCTTGYVIDIESGRIVAPVPWYSFAFAKRDDELRRSSLIGASVPGIDELLHKAVAAHAASDLPWLKSVGWDAMLTDNGFVFFEGNLGCGRLPRRIFFDWSSVNLWLEEFGTADDAMTKME